jgi:hypothetical protein
MPLIGLYGLLLFGTGYIVVDYAPFYAILLLDLVGWLPKRESRGLDD